MQPNIEPNLHFLEWRIFLLFSLGMMVENTWWGVENRSKKNIFTILLLILMTFFVIFRVFRQNDVTSGVSSIDFCWELIDSEGSMNNSKIISVDCTINIYNWLKPTDLPGLRSSYMDGLEKSPSFFATWLYYLNDLITTSHKRYILLLERYGHSASIGTVLTSSFLYRRRTSVPNMSLSTLLFCTVISNIPAKCV